MPGTPEPPCGPPPRASWSASPCVPTASPAASLCLEQDWAKRGGTAHTDEGSLGVLLGDARPHCTATSLEDDEMQTEDGSPRLCRAGPGCHHPRAAWPR